ncbi:MAG: hypothetical protein JKY30_07815 [Flavobacteriales bacterium]|nr:hypothetical protein [Flavobacteriales bacterium]
MMADRDKVKSGKMFDEVTVTANSVETELKLMMEAFAKSRPEEVKWEAEGKIYTLVSSNTIIVRDAGATNESPEYKFILPEGGYGLFGEDASDGLNYYRCAGCHSGNGAYSYAAYNSQERIQGQVIAATLTEFFPMLAAAKSGPKSFQGLVDNPRAIWGKSADEVGTILGDGWKQQPLNSGSGWKYVQKNGDGFVSYTTGNSHHPNSTYYKINSGLAGKNKVVGPGYSATKGDKSNIFYVD